MDMKKFCSNCGYANSEKDNVCVDCGKRFEQASDDSTKTVVKTASPKKPVPFKTKLIAGVVFALLVSVFGFYSWGTKAASSDTTVSKFFEALRAEDAESLAKYVILSNQEEMSVSEATAFIELYKGLGPDELDSMATLVKTGKIAGVFDTHKIMLTAQKLTYEFPYPGLELSLNEELIPSVQTDDGYYTFSGVAAGNYEAEFLYDDGETSFQYPFNLTVENQDDSAYETEIWEEIPLGTTIFTVNVFEQTPVYESKVLINDQELALNEFGQTEEAGPFLLDGSSTAKAVVDFPWGSVESEETAIDGESINIQIPGFGEELEKHLIERYALFVEERIQALATHDSSVYTTLNEGLLKNAKSEVADMKEYGSFFKGSVEEIDFAENFIILMHEQDSILMEGAAILNGAHYNNDYPSEDIPEVEEIGKRFQVTFSYDENLKEWFVENFDEIAGYDGGFEGQTIEGSKKFYETKGSSNSAKPVEEDSDTSEEDAVVNEEKEETANLSEEIESFMNQYNDSSVIAMNSGDFAQVSYFISEDGPKWAESKDYVDYIFEKGITEEHLGTTIENVETVDDTYIKVTSIDRYIIHGTEKTSEKAFRTTNILKKNGDSWLVYELTSTKEI